MSYEGKNKMRGQIETLEVTKQEKLVKSKEDATRKGKNQWKPKIEKLNCIIINDGNFVQLNKSYDL